MILLGTILLGTATSYLNGGCPYLFGALAGVIDDPYADVITDYQPGLGAAVGYANPLTVLGEPQRITGEGIDPHAVTSFHPAWRPDEIVSIGRGGRLDIMFNTPVTDDPNNPYGIDLIVFGNSLFIDGLFPNGLITSLASDGGEVWISDGGVSWTLVPNTIADGLHPTVGFVDAAPYQTTPGIVATDFTRPVDPTLDVGLVTGLSYAELLVQYRGAGGGNGIDIGALGFLQITHVRIENPIDGLENIEIDAMADVAPRTPGDVDYNGVVNIADLLALLSAWGPTVPGGLPADFTLDELVNVNDLLMMLSNWG